MNTFGFEPYLVRIHGYVDFNFRDLHHFLHQITIVIISAGHFLFGIQLIIFCYPQSIIFSFHLALRKL